MIALLNAGTHPELTHVARELSSRNIEYLYFTSSLIAEDELLAKIVQSRWMRATRAGKALRRRVTVGLRRKNLRRIGVGAEIAFQVAAKWLPERKYQLLRFRTSYFARVAAMRLRRNSRLSLVFANYTCAYNSFSTLPSSVRRILIYPIAHHAWMRENLRIEARGNVDWAQFLQGHDGPESQLRAMDREVELADLVIVPSSFVRKTFDYAGIAPSKVAAVPLGIDPDALSSGVEIQEMHGGGDVRPNTEDGPLRILFVGQVNQRKGISYLLDGFARARVGEAQLDLIGPCDRALAEKIAYFKNVNLLGSIPKFELGAYYKQADLLVLPSLAEGFGLVVLEAMSVGTPCAVTPYTLADDVIRDGVDGFIIPAAQSDAIAQLIADLAKRRTFFKEVGRRAQARSLEFSWPRYAATVCDLALSPGLRSLCRR